MQSQIQFDFFLVITDIVPHLIALSYYFHHLAVYKHQTQNFLEQVFQSNQMFKCRLLQIFQL